MCRYGFTTYKPHYACFTCRKTFKQHLFSDILRSAGKWKRYKELEKKSRTLNNEEDEELAGYKQKENRSVKCPQCGALMANLGLDFKSPPKNALKEWRIIEGLYVTGKDFHSCGCWGIGYIPKNPKDYRVYLNTVLKEYEKTLVLCQKTKPEDDGSKLEKISYWSAQITVIAKEIQHYK